MKDANGALLKPGHIVKAKFYQDDSFRARVVKAAGPFIMCTPLHKTLMVLTLEGQVSMYPEEIVKCAVEELL